MMARTGVVTGTTNIASTPAIGKLRNAKTQNSQKRQVVEVSLIIYSFSCCIKLEWIKFRPGGWVPLLSTGAGVERLEASGLSSYLCQVDQLGTHIPKFSGDDTIGGLW